MARRQQKFAGGFRCMAAASLALILSSASLQAEPLPVVVERVLLQQPSVQAAQALLQAAESQVSQARSEFFPTAGLSFRSAKLQDESLGQPIDRKQRRSDASVRWNIFNGTADFYRLKASRHARDAADADLDEALEALAAEISQNYMDIVRLQATQSCLGAVIEQQERLRGMIEKRVEAGRIAPSELDLIRTRLIQNQNLLGQFRAQLSSAEHRFQIITGGPPLELEFPGMRPESTGIKIDELIGRVAASNPRLRASWQRVAARDAEIGVARGSHLPAIDLEFSKRIANRTEPVLTSDTDSSSQIRVNFEVPLGGRNFSRQSEAQARHRAARSEAERLAQDLAREVSEQAGQLIEAWQIAPALTERVQAAQRVFFAYERQFNAGRRSVIDLSVALDELFEAQRSLIDNHSQQTMLQAHLLSLEGGLRRALATRHVASPIPRALLAALPAGSPIAIETIQAAPMLAPANDSPSTQEQIDKRIEHWRNSWASGDFTRYRKIYLPDFRPSDGLSTGEWEKLRRARLERAGAPTLRIESLRIMEAEQGQAISDFVQFYAARGFRDRVRKQLTWVRVNGEWLISAEKILASSDP